MNCDCELHLRGGYVVCEDCGEEIPVEELSHWRYEPDVLLCEDCTDERDKEDEED